MRIAIITTYADKLLDARSELITSIKLKGHSVLVLGTESNQKCTQIYKKENIPYYQIPFFRASTNPIKEIISIIKLSRLLKSLNVDLILVYGVRLSASCAISAQLAGVQEVYAVINGAGTLFNLKTLKGKIARVLSTPLLTTGLRFCKKIFFQNNDNRNLFITKHLINKEQAILVNGSGVNLEKFKSHPMPDNITFLFVGRVIRDKGVMEYLNAAKIVKGIYPEAKFLLVGQFDSNLTALNEADLKPFLEQEIVDHVQWTRDVYSYIKSSFVFVLPSYHEGIPRTTLEAMAVGRPIITTDAPGCRETVENNVNGFLVPIKDEHALAEKMIWMIENRSQAIQMGLESLMKCQEKFDVNKVNETMLMEMRL